MQLPATPYIHLTRRLIRPDELLVQTQFVTQFERGGFLSKKGIGSALDHKSVFMLCDKFAAKRGGTFNQGVCERLAPARVQMIRGGKSRDAAADYDNVFAPHP